MAFGMRPKAVVPGRFQASVEMFYDFVAGPCSGKNIGSAGKHTSAGLLAVHVRAVLQSSGPAAGEPDQERLYRHQHIIVTFAMALFVFVLATVVGFMHHGIHSVLLRAKGVPALLLPLMVPIEVMSYFIRPITLSVRLFANMVAGHVMLAVIGGFVFSLGGVFFLLGGIPLAAVVVIFALELLIACLQAYVFAVLTCIYLNDAIHMAH